MESSVSNVRSGNIYEFFSFVQKREWIRARRLRGEEWPWTDDPVLQQFRFCNVFREDDKVTQWFREHIRQPLSRDVHAVIRATIAFRWFNKIETGEILKPYLLRGSWEPQEIKKEMIAAREQGLALFTGAYMIKSEAKKPKLEAVLDYITNCDNVIDPIMEEYNSGGSFSLEELHERIMQIPYLGRFMAYEVVTDLAHTCIGQDAHDIMTWASAGPGCARGAGWIFKGEPKGYNYSSNKGQRELLEIMRDLLWQANEGGHWPCGWRPWTMREVEHTLCEYDKYRRAQAGQNLKRRYTHVS